MEHSILQCETIVLVLYQVCSDRVAHCVKSGSLIKHRSENQWSVQLGYLTISTNVRCNYHVVYNNFVFQQESAPLRLLAFNTVQLLQCKPLNFLSSELWSHKSPELNSTDEIQGVIQQHEHELQVTRLNKSSQRVVEVWKCISTTFE